MIAPLDDDKESVENKPSFYDQNLANASTFSGGASKNSAVAATMRRTASSSALSGMAVDAATMSAGNFATAISNAKASIQCYKNEPQLQLADRKISSLTRTKSLPSNQNLSRIKVPLKESFQQMLPASAALAKNAKIEKRNSTPSLKNAPDKNCNTSENVSGRWTAEEHEAFLAGLKIYGREWKKVANCIPTRTSAQIRSHAQKYFAKLSKENLRQKMLVGEDRCSSCPSTSAATYAAASSDTNPSLLMSGRSMSSSFLEMANTICRDPSALEERVTKTLAALKERYAQLEAGLKQIQSSSSTYDSPTLEGQQGQLAVKVTPEQLGASATAAATATNAMGPATAALAKEQKSLREAAKARYEMKKLNRQSDRGNERSAVAGSNDQSKNNCACVSMSSIPSRGDFDSDEVLALSVLGGTLGRESISATTIETTSRARTNDSSHQQSTQQQTDESLAQGQENIEYATRPAKLRKTNSKNEL